MAKKKSKKYNIDEEVIIGYNTKLKKDNPPKKKSKKKKKKGKWNKIKKIILVLFKIILILAVLAGIIAFLFISPVFNITEIKVENAEKISENTYIALSEVEIGENIFRISKLRIRNLIKEEPYVEEVEVKREYPGTVLLKVTEREPKYLIEKDGMYIYIDQNGYALEISSESLDLPILKGIVTDLSTLEMGDRILDEDLSKFNDLIKIVDGIKNNNIEAKLSNIDILDNNNYVLEFEEENKTAILGDTSNLSTKMLWIRYFIEQRKEEKGIIHLNAQNVYFAPAD